jgi:hypothetical protein
MHLIDKNKHQAGHLWLRPVFLVTQEAEIMRIMVEAKSGK